MATAAAAAGVCRSAAATTTPRAEACVPVFIDLAVAPSDTAPAAATAAAPRIVRASSSTAGIVAHCSRDVGCVPRAAVAARARRAIHAWATRATTAAGIPSATTAGAKTKATALAVAEAPTSSLHRRLRGTSSAIPVAPTATAAAINTRIAVVRPTAAATERHDGVCRAARCQDI